MGQGVPKTRVSQRLQGVHKKLFQEPFLESSAGLTQILMSLKQLYLVVWLFPLWTPFGSLKILSIPNLLMSDIRSFIPTMVKSKVLHFSNFLKNLIYKIQLSETFFFFIYGPIFMKSHMKVGPRALITGKILRQSVTHKNNCGEQLAFIQIGCAFYYHCAKHNQDASRLIICSLHRLYFKDTCQL